MQLKTQVNLYELSSSHQNYYKKGGLGSANNVRSGTAIKVEHAGQNMEHMINVDKKSLISSHHGNGCKTVKSGITSGIVNV